MPASAARALLTAVSEWARTGSPSRCASAVAAAQGRGVVLLRARVGGRRVAAARGHELDRVDAGLLRLADAGDDGVGRVGLATEEPVVPGRGRDRRPDHQQARPGDGAVPGRGPDREGDVQPAAGVARGRRAGQQQARMAAVARMSERSTGSGRAIVAVVRGGREVHVDVRLDEARQQRHVAEVVDLVGRRDVRRQLAGAPDRRDPAVDHLDRRVRQPAVGRRVRDARGADQLSRRHGSLRRRAATAAAGR